MWRLNFDMTDYTGSVTVQKNLTVKEAQALEKSIKVGMWLRVQGKMEPTWDGKDIQLNPYHIQEAEHKGRQDTAPEKRVELHLHTKMSNMDALTDTKEAIQQAIRWGHPAIAITDHGVAQSFPDAWHAAGDKIKILYGMEGYFINDVDDRIAVHGPQDQPLEGGDCLLRYRDYRLESRPGDHHRDRRSGVEKRRDWGAFPDLRESGTPPDARDYRTDRHYRRNAQGCPLAERGADGLFLEFVDGRPLAAHNAEFDIGFIRAGCRQVGLEFAPTYVDSLILAQNLLPDLSKHKLDIVAERLDLPAFNHHRASDDAATVGYMLIPFWKMLHDRGFIPCKR